MSAVGPSATRALVRTTGLAGPSGRDTALGRLTAGEVFVELCDDDTNGRASALEVLLAAVGQETTLRWISNPLRSPLTLERLFLQAVGPDADLRVERSAAELAGLLQQAAGGARSCLVIVQQPETLDAEARDMLARIVPYLTEGPATIQFLFCCTRAFRPIVPVPVGRNLPVLSLYADAPDETRRSPWRKLLPVLLLVVACLGGMVFLTRSLPPGRSPAEPIETSSVDAADFSTVHEPAATGQAVRAPIGVAPAVATPALAVPAASAPTAAAPAVATPELGAPGSNSPSLTDSATSFPRIDVATVRREFDTFLAQQSPRIANLNQQQRDALFNEFLLHYRHDDKREP